MRESTRSYTPIRSRSLFHCVMPFTIDIDKEELYGAQHNPKDLENLDTPLIVILAM